MEHLVIAGGVPLEGEVRPSGAKNAVLKLMAACLLTPEPCVLDNVPAITDVLTMVRLLEAVGARVQWTGPDQLTVCARGCLSGELPEEAVRAMRASVQALGPLVARVRYARASHPGGCDIGERPLDFHLRGLQAMGAEVREEGGTLTVRANRLHGAEIVLDFPSVGATENLMTAAVLARGRTEIHNAAREPEVVELQEFLRAMGAHVEGAGTGTIRIEGVSQVRGARWRLMPDRVETATWMLAAAITGGHVKIREARPDHVAAVSSRLRLAGTYVEPLGSGLEVRGPEGRPAPVSVRTQPHPGFPTDVQPMWTAFMSIARGTSIIREEVHSRRFGYVRELWRMGAQIALEGRTAVVCGVEALSGASLTATDLRGGAALVLAGLAAHGESRVSGLHHLRRGYEDLDRKLAALGARVRRADDGEGPPG